MSGLTQPLEFRRHMTSAPKQGFDVIPFLDAFLIVLFVALNTSAFVVAPGATIQLPVSSTVEASPDVTTAVLTVDRNQLYFFEGRKLAEISLQARLKDYVDLVKLSGPEEETVLLIKADSSITSSTLFQLMEIARNAGFNQVHLAAEQEKSIDASLEWDDQDE
jgi:biopolymer transport protein ExbD